MLFTAYCNCVSYCSQKNDISDIIVYLKLQKFLLLHLGLFDFCLTEVLLFKLKQTECNDAEGYI